MNLPSADELLASSAVVALPMRTPFRGITVREAMLFQGPAGWGEFAPFIEYDDVEAASWLAAGIEAAYQGFPDPLRSSVEVNATVPAVAAEEVSDVLSGFPGARVAKVKVAEPGCTLDEEVDRVAAARSLVPTVRVDANGGWSVDEAVRAITAFGDVEYVEQPCRSVEELAAVRGKVRTPIAADESIRKADDPLRVVRAGAADVAVLKVAPLGGVRRVLELADSMPLRTVISSALDTAVGIAAGVAAAAALPVAPPACGLGTGSLFVTDVVPSHLPVGSSARPVMAQLIPRLVVPTVFPAASCDRTTWWHNRLRRCLAVLAGR